MVFDSGGIKGDGFRGLWYWMDVGEVMGVVFGLGGMGFWFEIWRYDG